MKDYGAWIVFLLGMVAGVVCGVCLILSMLSIEPLDELDGCSDESSDTYFANVRMVG